LQERLLLTSQEPFDASRPTSAPCWKAYREGDPQTPLVIKDSWQYTEREEEGELLREATNRGVVNVARYYHHETVRVLGTDDDVRSNVRKGLDIMKAEDYRLNCSMISLGKTLKGCIKGHESLPKAGFLYRDISINNLMINKDEENPYWPSFLIDLDLGIKESRRGASGAKGKTGTMAFMAIEALLDEQYSFMHDLESIF
ncbi:hypothetical protein DL95DRAFT_311291, partial [Leptodontidium sp. 2 PMI_412]